jgi:hypothetical protein
VSWAPRLILIKASLSDDLGPDAEGRLLSFEWFGVLLELAFYRRER